MTTLPARLEVGSRGDGRMGSPAQSPDSPPPATFAPLSRKGSASKAIPAVEGAAAAAVPVASAAAAVAAEGLMGVTHEASLLASPLLELSSTVLIVQ